MLLLNLIDDYNYFRSHDTQGKTPLIKYAEINSNNSMINTPYLNQYPYFLDLEFSLIVNLLMNYALLRNRL